MKSKLLIGSLLLTLAFISTACQEKGPAQKAGEKIDNAVENVKNKSRDAIKKAGDEIDNAVENVKDKSRDAIEKAGDQLEEMGDKIEEKTD